MKLENPGAESKKSGNIVSIDTRNEEEGYENQGQLCNLQSAGGVYVHCHGYSQCAGEYLAHQRDGYGADIGFIPEPVCTGRHYFFHLGIDLYFTGSLYSLSCIETRQCKTCGPLASKDRLPVHHNKRSKCAVDTCMALQNN